VKAETDRVEDHEDRRCRDPQKSERVSSRMPGNAAQREHPAPQSRCVPRDRNDLHCQQRDPGERRDDCRQRRKDEAPAGIRIGLQLAKRNVPAGLPRDGRQQPVALFPEKGAVETEGDDYGSMQDERDDPPGERNYRIA
jgi:hypothetical protein